MNKEGFIEHVAGEEGIPKTQAEKAINAVLKGIVSALAEGETVSITGFGNFSAPNRPERKSRNPKTGESVIVPAKRVVSFKPGKTFKDRVNEPIF